MDLKLVARKVIWNWLMNLSNYGLNNYVSIYWYDKCT